MKKLTTLMLVAACGGSTGTPNETIDAPTSTVVDDGGTSTDGDLVTNVDANVTPATNDKCSAAQPIALATAHASIAATNVGSTADLTAPCGTAGMADVFFKFTLTRRELVYADTFGAASAHSLYFATSCGTAMSTSTTGGDAVCSENACGTNQAQVTALLDPGTYYLVMAGEGAATIHFQHAEVGTGAVATLARGSTTTAGTTSGFGGLYQCDAGGPENAYWWKTCPTDAGGQFTASTCDGTTFDTILSLQVPGTDTVMCDDDTCSFQSTVSAALPTGAGLFVVAVDGFSSAKKGTYTLAATRP